MPLTIYGNYLPLDAPVSLQVDIVRLEKLYSFSDVNGYGQITTSGLAASIGKEKAGSDNPKNVSASGKNRAAT